jgi:ubiquinone/menaquinone biosynthesis C-methylase UbiE
MPVDPSQGKPVFRADFFEVPSLDVAKRITVTAEKGTTTEERWRKETPWIVEDMGVRVGVGPESQVLDYGCGTGRIAKGLIERFGCRVVGVDSSRSMRALAPEYVLSERFTVWSPELLDQMLAKGTRFDHACCVWVIQHVPDPGAVIRTLHAALRPGGRLYLVNGRTRCVPTNRGYVNDGYDVAEAMRATFQEEHFSALPESVTTPELSRHSMIQVLHKGD